MVDSEIVAPAEAGVQEDRKNENRWIPASAGMTKVVPGPLFAVPEQPLFSGTPTLLEVDVALLHAGPHQPDSDPALHTDVFESRYQLSLDGRTQETHPSAFRG